MFNSIKAWLFDVELKKGLQLLAHGAAGFVCAHLAAPYIAPVAAALHVQPDPSRLQAVLVVMFTTAVNWALVKAAQAFPKVAILQALATPHPTAPPAQ